MASNTRPMQDADKIDPSDTLLQQIFAEICKHTIKHVLCSSVLTF